MRLSVILLAVFCAGTLATAQTPKDISDDNKSLVQADRALFSTDKPSAKQFATLLDANFTWTDSSGATRDKSEILRGLKSGEKLPLEIAPGHHVVPAHTEGRIAVVSENIGKLYVLRVWVKRGAKWQLLVYQAVASGAPASNEPGNADCNNPCKTVPFEPKTDDERDVIHAYQAVERAVTAHDSAAWGSHIADEFFAVTSNSDRPLNKAARMAGLDSQKVAGIAPFPLVSACMYEFGDAMVMTSRQQPEHGLPLHVTRIWLKRNGTWLEAYSYQTTIR